MVSIMPYNTSSSGSCIIQLVQANLISLSAARAIMFPDEPPVDTAEPPTDYIFPVRHICGGIAFYAKRWWRPGEFMPAKVMTPDGRIIYNSTFCRACGSYILDGELVTEAP